MGRIKKYTRRAFVIGSAAVAGGVAFGVYQAKRSLPNPLSASAGETVLNPYVIIDQNGVTIIAPRAEMGQGIHSALAAMAAEELDVDWRDVTVLHGPPAQIYYNGALMQGHARYDDREGGFLGNLQASAMDVLPKTLGLQVTGGSTSSIDGFEKMRMAGAMAREMLKMAAVKQGGGPDIGQWRTENGFVISPDETKIVYADLAEIAATLTPPKSVPLKAEKDWKILSHDMPRPDMLAKSTGTAQYGADKRLKGMKFATVRMNPHLGGVMLSMNSDVAQKMAGVERIVDLETGFAVIASNTWLAMQAADAVEVVWGKADFPSTNAAINRKIEDSLENPANSTGREDGDLSKRYDGAISVAADYHVPFLAHTTMEPMNATALFTGETLEIWCGNQAPLALRDAAANAVGLDGEKVHVHVPFMGGGFGRRVEADAGVLAARIAKAMPNTPIKTMWRREEDIQHDFYRPAAAAQFHGIVHDGKAVLLDAKIAAPSVTRQSVKRFSGFETGGADSAHLEAAAEQPYAIENYRIRGYLTDLNIPVGYWRSVASSFNGFFHESFIDEMAHAAGADPLAFRRDLIAPNSQSAATVLDVVQEMSNWTGTTPKGIGRGVAFTWSFGTPVAQVIEVQQTDDGIKITKAWIACDVGTALDPRNIRAQMESGLIYGLSAAVHGEISFENGRVEQRNFPDYDALRMGTVPQTEVRILENNTHLGGVGEPGTPPSMPALANALFDLTGTRARTLPLAKSFDFISA